MNTRWALLIVALLACIVALIFGAQKLPLVQPAEGSAGSSLSEAPDGASAFFDLFPESGEPAEHWRDDLREIPMGGTIVEFTPDRALDAGEAAELIDYVREGGVVLWVGEEVPELFSDLGVVLERLPLPSKSRPQAVSPWVDPSSPIEGTGLVMIPETAPLRMLYGGLGGARVGEVIAGAGRLVVVSDPSVLSNRGLLREGNLRFAWRLASGLPRPVQFDERHHGLGTRRGILAYLAHREALGAALWFSGVVLLAVWRWARRREWEEVEVAGAGLPGRAALVQTMADALADEGKHRDALEHLAQGRPALPAGVVRALARAQIDGATLVREANALYDSSESEERR